MEVVDACSALLSNREVLELLRNNISKKQQTNLATILYETTSYLESSPIANSSMKNLAEFLDILKENKYDLSKLEKIQLANLIPQNESELLLMIDKFEEKFTEEQRSNLLQIIQNTLNKPCDQDEQTRKKLKQ